MPPDARTYLFDMQHAAASIAEFTAGKTLDDYVADSMRRAAVERQFEIIGEALSRLANMDADLAARIGEYQRIIAFRNILIHGYAGVDDRVGLGHRPDAPSRAPA